MWHNRFIILTSDPNNALQVNWLNTSFFPILPSNELYFGLTTKFRLYDDILAHDVRVLPLSNGDLHIVYHNRAGMRYDRNGVSNLLINSSNLINFDSGLLALHIPEELNQDHKNWTPFEYNQTIYYISTINPFHVVAISSINNITLAGYMKTISRSIHLPLQWQHIYGSIHGGSQAILFDNNSYISFFHSKIRLEHNTQVTYFMGAYRFTSKPPFELISMTPYPLIHEQFYTGRWVVERNRQLDYVVFPTGISLIDGVIYLSLGWNDNEGYMTTINVQDLLDLMVPVDELLVKPKRRF